ncbi:MAG: hypothetical protein ACTTJ3_09275, partial [Treponema sp.]
NIFYGEGKYGNHIIRVVITEHRRFFHGKHQGRVLLLSNSGEQVGIVSSTIGKEGQYLTHFTEASETDYYTKGCFRWSPSLYNFVFYEYRVTQKIRIPNIQFGKPSERNILYRDENGFIKIS